MTLLALVAALALTGPVAAAPPVSRECGASASAAGVRTTWLRTADGERIYAAELGRGARGVVVGHELGANLCSWLSLGGDLSGAGFHVLLVDFRGFGLSPRPGPRPWNLAGDFAAAAAELRRRGATSVALVGGSMGGTAAILAGATLHPAVSAVVCVSGGGDLADFLGGPHGPVDATLQAGEASGPPPLVGPPQEPTNPPGHYTNPPP